MTDPAQRCSRRSGGYERWDMGGHPCTHKAKTIDKDGKPICGVHAGADKRAAAREAKYRDTLAAERDAKARADQAAAALNAGFGAGLFRADWRGTRVYLSVESAELLANAPVGSS